MSYFFNPQTKQMENLFLPLSLVVQLKARDVTLLTSLFHLIPFNPQSHSSTIIHVIHIYNIWLHSYYIVIQRYCL